MTGKEAQYRALISDVRQFYIKQKKLHEHEPVYLTWCDDCEEINLWTYWQGRGNLDAKIMLGGQDWGSLSDTNEQFMAQFNAINSGRISSYRLDASSITDKNLIKLFSSIGYSIASGEPRNPDLFFTNYVLGYRNRGLSGKFNSWWLSENKEFFSRLANIIEPEIIICLGRRTFQGVMMAFDQKVELGNYNAFITGENNPIEITLHSGKKTHVFAEAHCGAMGTLNRNRLKSPGEATGIPLQIKDWAKIKDYLSPTP